MRKVLSLVGLDLVYFGVLLSFPYLVLGCIFNLSLFAVLAGMGLIGLIGVALKLGGVVSMLPGDHSKPA